MQRGKFFVFDGIDGSGKATQAKLLMRRLRQTGHRVRTIDFPQYGEKSAGPIEKYLTGVYGNADMLSPYATSILYAVDRYDASFKIKRWLDAGNIVVTDRYSTANIGHQGGKLVRNERAWRRYVLWDYDLEYGIFGIPKPDQVFILKSDPATSRKLLLGKVLDRIKSKKRAGYLKGKKRDVLERNVSHQMNALRSFLMFADAFPKECTVIPCVAGGTMLPKEAIHERVWEKLQKFL
jgi:dTMP kinase